MTGLWRLRAGRSRARRSVLRRALSTGAVTLRPVVVLCVALLATTAAAQSGRSARTPSGPALVLRGFADAGLESFHAADSFRAVFGSPSAPVVGGGVSLLTRHGLFGEVRLSRVRKTGERVIVLDGTVYPLGVPNTVSLVPLEVSAGYRWNRRGWRTVPYVGGGVGWHRYRETAPAAIGAEESVSTFTGVQVAGGVEVPLSRWLAAGGEVRWSSVPGALDGPNSVGAALGESNLGGLGVLARVVIGRR